MGPEAASRSPRRTAAEDVYLALKRELLTLAIEPGAPLREQELAARLGTSRVPVREACRRLQQEGLVSSVPYKGYFAGRISLRELSEAFELRHVLETHALTEALDRARESELDALEALSASEYAHSDRDSWEVFLARNTEFHVALAELAGNGRLVRILRDLLEGMQRYFFLGLALGDYGAEMRSEHELLLGLIRAGEKDEAVACLGGQIERSRERILAALLREGADLPIA